MPCPARTRAGGLRPWRDVQRTLVEYCAAGLQRMERLVEDVADETRIHRGQLALHLEPRDLVSVVGEAVAEQVALHPERAIHCVAEASPVPVLADASRIQQVVANVVSNALKFSRDDQAVEVRVSPTDGVAQVAVHDDGVAIPPAEQPHIWEQFYQAAGVQVQSGSQTGVGMGLYISKAIVEGHHGRVGIDSAAGQGTTIWLLPLPVASPENDAHTDETQTDAQTDEAQAQTPGPMPGDHQTAAD